MRVRITFDNGVVNPMRCMAVVRGQLGSRSDTWSESEVKQLTQLKAGALAGVHFSINWRQTTYGGCQRVIEIGL